MRVRRMEEKARTKGAEKTGGRKGKWRRLACVCVMAALLAGPALPGVGAAEPGGGSAAASGLAIEAGGGSGTQAAGNAGFSDLPAGHWAYAAVMEMAKAGVVAGYPDGSFRPAGVVTYGEFIKMAVTVGSGAPAGAAAGDDAAAHWAGPYYDEGLGQGWFSSWDISKKALDQPIPRALMALICSGILDTDAPENYGELLDSIVDVQPGNPYEYEIVTAYGAGLLTGYPDGSFCPQGTLTRAEAAMVISRLAAASPFASTGLPAPEAVTPAAIQPPLVLDPDTGTPFPPPAPAKKTDEYGFTVFDDPYPAGVLFREENRETGYQRIDYEAGDYYERNPLGFPAGTLLIAHYAASDDITSQLTRMEAALKDGIAAHSGAVQADFFTFFEKDRDKFRQGFRTCAYGDSVVFMERAGDYGRIYVLPEGCRDEPWDLSPGEIKEELF